MLSAIYEMHVAGVIDEADLAEFVGMSHRVEDGQSVLTGVVADQSALAGLVARVEMIGCSVTELVVVDHRADRSG